MITSLCGKRRFRIIHLSDLGLRAEPSAGLERVALEVDALSPDVVLVSGGLTAQADEPEFYSARQALAALAGAGMPGQGRRRRPVVVVPGSRDRLWAGRFDEHLVDYLPPGGYPYVRTVGSQLAVIGLDSTRVPSYAGYVFGRLGDEQLDRLDEKLRDPSLAGRAIAVLVHHAPLDAEARGNPFAVGLLDGARLLELTAGRCVAMFSGHLSRRFRLSPAPGRPELFCAGPALRPGAAGYWVVDVEDNRVINAEQFVPDLAEDENDRRVA